MTLKQDDLNIMQKQIDDATGKMIPKDKVLRVVQDKLKDADMKNQFRVDRIDGIVLKELLNIIANEVWNL